MIDFGVTFAWLVLVFIGSVWVVVVAYFAGRAWYAGRLSALRSAFRKSFTRSCGECEKKENEQENGNHSFTRNEELKM